ncbi:hypothetical protein K0M31_006388 [Melipona bicolor]|uniref:Uncharacterized protein n=1 Tax=Melipona bicolor TaxID=60889 RepID=A0AA40KLP8_9HYME|nr:hypothetical protein K0M31_006388 [Melipona bicolor]
MPRNVSNGRVKSSVGQRTGKPNGGPLTSRVTKPRVREPSSRLVECVINKRISVPRTRPEGNLTRLTIAQTLHGRRSFLADRRSSRDQGAPISPRRVVRQLLPAAVARFAASEIKTIISTGVTPPPGVKTSSRWVSRALESCSAGWSENEGTNEAPPEPAARVTIDIRSAVAWRPAKSLHMQPLRARFCLGSVA